MEPRKLTKADIDKVRHIEGFPIGSDEDIIALSNAPYYTACPNPFIEEFIRENGTPYDEQMDNYHREPFAADVSGGKYDPLYKLHPYHTKVPHQAIMEYIKHYADEGAIVLDGFCGTGMAGVATQILGDKSELLKAEGADGKRRSMILVDISPAATFISEVMNTIIHKGVGPRFLEILEKADAECGWMYKTRHGAYEGTISSVIWSDVYICPHCGEELVFWHVAVDYEGGKVLKQFPCPKCNAKIKKSDCEHAKERVLKKDNVIHEFSKQVPVVINYSCNGKKYDKTPEKSDIDLLTRIEQFDCETWYPTDLLPEGMNTDQPIKSHGFTSVDDFYFRRSLIYLSTVWSLCSNSLERGIVSKILFRLTKRYALTYMSGTWGAGGGPTPGTLFIPALVKELNIGKQLRDAMNAYAKIPQTDTNSRTLISTQSSTDLGQIGDNSIDYIFTDPPFGSNINYSELNCFWESWLKVKTNIVNESIVNDTQNKGLKEYSDLITKTFCEYFRVLKPNRWITVEFHNSQNAIWNAIQNALAMAGFVIADVRVLDKGKESFKQITSTSAVKQDLVISAYKPRESFRKNMVSMAGDKSTAWAFVQQHLENIPVVVVKGGKIEIISERQAYLLFDRMVAYHIMQGIPVPIDSTEFYRGLDEKYLKRDGMYFLSDQVNEYDTTRIKTDVEPIQLSLFVTNEKSAISWLYQQLGEDFDGPQTYAELQPKFMQEVKSVDKFEAMPELSVLLEENFLQDEKGRWYIPDTTKEGDVAKLREKKLWKEFEGYMSSKGKLKLFRSEAIRVGFSRLWKDKNYQAIVDLAERLPEQTIQEDANLLMYYDISLSRV